MRKRKSKYEVLEGWLGHETDDVTCEPIYSMVEHIPGMIKDYLYTTSERHLKTEIPDLYF